MDPGGTVTPEYREGASLIYLITALFGGRETYERGTVWVPFRFSFLLKQSAWKIQCPGSAFSAGAEVPGSKAPSRGLPDGGCRFSRRNSFWETLFPVDFSQRIGYHSLKEVLTIFGGVPMKKGSKLAVFIGVVAAIAAVVASVSALLLYLDKKRDEEELEHYLDCSIQ